MNLFVIDSMDYEIGHAEVIHHKMKVVYDERGPKQIKKSQENCMSRIGRLVTDKKHQERGIVIETLRIETEWGNAIRG